MMPYLLHVATLTAGIYLFYQLFLRSETFFKLNRWVLLSGLALVFILPMIAIPQDWSFRQVEAEDTKPLVLPKSEAEKPMMVMNESPVRKKRKKPFSAKEIEITEASEQVAPPEVAQPAPPLAPIPTTTVAPSRWLKISWKQGLSYLYLGGLIVFAINFLIQLIVLLAKSLRRADMQDGPFRIIELEKDEGPFSFWNTIFLNPSKYDPDTFRQILNHEKIHVAQRHSIDILLAELLLIVQWFNPFAWMYRKAVENNLEFLTDLEMLNSGADREQYQMSLLRVSVPHLPLHLTSNYNQSILKKRILMMNGKKSSLQSMWKYLMILPLLGCSMLFMNAVIPHDMERLESFKDDLKEEFLTPSPQTHSAVANTAKATLADHQPTKADLPTKQNLIAAEQNASAVEQDIIPATSQDNTVRFFTDKRTSVMYSSSFSDRTKITSGDWKGKVEGSELCLKLSADWEVGKTYHWVFSDCSPKANYSALPMGQRGSFTLQRDPGTVTFEGQFDGEHGQGEYKFQANEDFQAFLRSEGITKLEDEERTLFVMCLNDIKRSFVTDLKSAGFKNITGSEMLSLIIHEVDMAYAKEMLSTLGKDLTIDQLVAAKIHDVEANYIAQIRSAGYPNIKYDEIIGFAIHDIDVNYIKALQAAGLNDLKAEEITAAAIHDIDAAYIQKMRAAGFKDMKFEELVGFAIHDVDPEFIQSLKSAGLGDLSAEEITAAAIHDIDADYIKKMQAAGFKDMKFEELVGFAIHDVDPAYIQALKAAGLGDLSAEEITAAAIHDIDADYIKKMQAAGLDMKFEDLVGFAIHDIDPDYIQELKAAGLDNLSNEDITAAAIHDIDADYIKKMQAAGFKDMKFDELVGFAIHDVDPEFIQELQSAGLGDLTSEQITAAAIHDVDADYIKEVKAAGVKNLTFENIIAMSIHDVDVDNIEAYNKVGLKDLTAEELISMEIHNVSPSFIQKMQEKGHKNKTVKEYIELKIHNGKSYH